MMTDYWAENDTVFVHYGQGWCVGKNGTRYCIGKYPPDKLTEPIASSVTPSKFAVTPPSTSKVPNLNYETLPDAIRHRGRPVKTGQVHRATLWRRAKQAVML